MSDINRTKSTAFFGLMLALAIILGFIESLLPPLPYAPPGVKLGLSNIIIMYCLFFEGRKEAFIIAFLKSGFVFLLRGATAGMLSLCGGVLSLAVIIIIVYLFKDKISYTMLSVAGAVSHNIGQLITVSLIMNFFALWYLPALLVSGVVTGCATGAMLKVVMPVFERIRHK